jgi:hypothetical protein
MQTKTLLWRNLNIFLRKKKILLFMLLTPFMICFMLRYLYIVGDTLRNVSNFGYPVETIDKAVKCTAIDEAGCVSIGYSIIGEYDK